MRGATLELNNTPKIIGDIRIEMCILTNACRDQMVHFHQKIGQRGRLQGVLMAETERETWIYRSKVEIATRHVHIIMGECLVDSREKSEHARNVARA